MREDMNVKTISEPSGPFETASAELATTLSQLEAALGSLARRLEAALSPEESMMSPSPTPAAGGNPDYPRSSVIKTMNTLQGHAELIIRQIQRLIDRVDL